MIWSSYQATDHQPARKDLESADFEQCKTNHWNFNKLKQLKSGILFKV